MNYDALSTLTEDKLNFMEETAGPGIHIEEGQIEEEQAAIIQNIEPPPATATITPQQKNSATIEEEQAAIIQNIQQSLLNSSYTEANEPPATTATATPQRKISATSRFMNAFQQFTGAATTSSSTAGDEVTTQASNSTMSSRTPTKGMESKLMSMWHNMKYGFSGRIRSSFSKEQPVWLLGRCYHHRKSPPSSMENSTDLTALTSATCVIPAPNNPQELVEEIVVPQELGMDCAAESPVGDQSWEEGIEGFRRDFYSRIWMTYRREFPFMDGTNGTIFTSDCGWGCMLRTGQMLLAQGLICHFLGRSWRFDPDSQLHTTYEDNIHKKIIKWFGDSSSKSSPFSIHTLVRLGQSLGKKPGDWYGPASVSFLLKQALKNAAQENADFDNITIYIARDCTIYMQDVEEACQVNEPVTKSNVPWQTTHRNMSAGHYSASKQYWKSLIVLIPLRLGTEKLNPVYAHCLKLLLSTEYCIGIIGGRPKHSLYFVGFQEDKFIHLDPHYCQEMVDVNQENFSLASFHCKSPRKLKTAKMDPSCCIGFYCQTKSDFDNFVESVQLYLNPMRCASGTVDRVTPASQQIPCPSNSTGTFSEASSFTEMNYPLFSFSRGRCMDHEQRDEMSDSLYKPEVLRQVSQLSNSSAFCTLEDDDSETEEFVLL